MDIYHIWGNLKDGVSDTQFADNTHSYLGHLKEQGMIQDYRITRRKLGLGPSHLPEFHLMLEVKDLAQLDEAFKLVSGRASPVEGLHHGVNSLVTNVMFALYRDFPDPHRQRGEERF